MAQLFVLHIPQTTVRLREIVQPDENEQRVVLENDALQDEMLAAHAAAAAAQQQAEPNSASMPRSRDDNELPTPSQSGDSSGEHGDALAPLAERQRRYSSLPSRSRPRQPDRSPSPVDVVVEESSSDSGEAAPAARARAAHRVLQSLTMAHADALVNTSLNWQRSHADVGATSIALQQGSNTKQMADALLDSRSPFVRLLDADEKRAFLAEALNLSESEIEVHLSQYDAIEIDLEHVVTTALWQLKVKTPMVMLNDNGVDLCVMFVAQSQRRAEAILNELRRLGVGDDFGSVSLLPVTLTQTSTPSAAQPFGSESPEPEEDVEDSAGIKARVMVAQVVEATRESARFTFDFVMLCIVAAIIAAMGLATNSAVIVVASMLVSPLMSPVLAVSFGTMINDRPLVRLGFKSECLALFLIVVTGGLVALPLAPFADETFEWPTDEMKQRGNAQALLTGAAIAFPSGLGVALSVLGSNMTSLVGVAISASLLPPCAMTGMCLLYALVLKVRAESETRINEFLEMGMYSFLLTMENIVLIFIAALIMFKIKEVAPIPGKTDFWKVDVQVARRYNENVQRMGREDLDRLRQAVAAVNETAGPPANWLTTQNTIYRQRHPDVGTLRESTTATPAFQPVSLMDVFAPLQQQEVSGDVQLLRPPRRTSPTTSQRSLSQLSGRRQRLELASLDTELNHAEHQSHHQFNHRSEGVRHVRQRGSRRPSSN